MSYRGPNNSGHWQNNGFERNKYRQTMPTRFNPLSPPRHQNVSRLQSQNAENSKLNSPTLSTATNYNQPWSSPKLPSPRNARRFRRSEEPEKSEKPNEERPKINFKDLTRKFAGKFRGGAKKPTDQSVRMSAPVLELAEPCSSSSNIRKSPAKRVRLTSTSKMQPDDRMKMFQRLGREKAMTPAQRMQKERQRDFHLVPGPGRACLEHSEEAKSTQNTPKPLGDVTLISSCSASSSSSSSVPTQQSPVVLKPNAIKQEARDTSSTTSSSSQCPSVESPRAPEPTNTCSELVPVGFTHNEQLNTLWKVSQVIREHELQLESSIPLLDRFKLRCTQIENEKRQLIFNKNENPEPADMRRLWFLEHELQGLVVKINQTGMKIQVAENWLRHLIPHRNALLAGSDAPNAPIPASFV